ncbi:hypothetical protein BH10PSE17_BH10PSE17_05600 [soil metagenome]
MRRFAVITTCHSAGYERYGRTMVESYLEHWPVEVPLLLYHEGFEPPVAPGRLIARDLESSSPGLVAFKARHLDNPRAHGLRKPWRRVRVGPIKVMLPMRTRKDAYRWNAVRFAHKSFALFDAARRTDADVLIWVDADTLFFDSIDLAELELLAPPDSAAACLRRPQHTEAGFLAYNLRHPDTRRLLDEFEAMYTRDLLFKQREFHDAYLFDVVRERAEARGVSVHDIGEGIGWTAPHVLINSRLGRFMDHMKGGRKEDGGSRGDDLVVVRDEPYWQRLKRD